jgi:hypothetical protein
MCDLAITREHRAARIGEAVFWTLLALAAFV